MRAPALQLQLPYGMVMVMHVLWNLLPALGFPTWLDSLACYTDNDLHAHVLLHILSLLLISCQNAQSYRQNWQLNCPREARQAQNLLWTSQAISASTR